MDCSKYLKISIHDNDFTTSLQFVAEILYNIFYCENKYPDETDFENLKSLIAHIWYGAHEVMCCMRWKNTMIKNKVAPAKDYIKYLTPDLEIVNKDDIPEDDDWESVYIPLFNVDLNSADENGNNYILTR